MSNFKCMLCPRKCKVDRQEKLGFCKAPYGVKIARAALHFDEEPSISGTKGSGAIFFSCCTLRCLFCQNEKISKDCFGQEITVDRLVEIFFELQQKGAQNINLVSPTPYIPWIKEAIEKAKKKGFRLPFIYNTSGYERKESLKELDGLIDIYMPDFKYMKDETALEFSKCSNYVTTVKEAIQEMFRQTGPNQFDEDGQMIKGVLVRHLVLPSLEKESKAILKYLWNTYHHQIYISIMKQYTPIESVKNHPILKNKVDDKIYDEIVDEAIELGIENAYIQENGSQDECYIPSFNLEGVCKQEKKC